MGIRDWFGGKHNSLRSVRAPSPEYATSRDAIEAIVRAHPDIGERGDWITFEAEGQGKRAIVEIAEHRVNFGKAEVNLPQLLRQAGLSALAEGVRPGGQRENDKTLWVIDHASPDEYIEVVDFAFTTVFDLGPRYRVKGTYQQ